MEISADLQTVTRIVAALVIGGIIGGEREYRSKAAGFRTMTLICLGSTIFTILSLKLGANTSPDRIASNIITGIGFIGAGVIFKDGITISGLTTATSIWGHRRAGNGGGSGESGSLRHRPFTLSHRACPLRSAAGRHRRPSSEAILQVRVRYQSARSGGPRRATAPFRRELQAAKGHPGTSAVSCWYDVWGNT